MSPHSSVRACTQRSSASPRLSHALKNGPAAMHSRNVRTHTCSWKHESDGKFILKWWESKHVSVKIDLNYKDLKAESKCPIGSIASAAWKGAQDMGIDPGEFHFREHYFPGNELGCRSGAIAQHACGHFWTQPNPGACAAWYYGGGHAFRHHELGHTIGVRLPRSTTHPRP